MKYGKVSSWLWWSVGAPEWETNTRNGFTHNGVTSTDRQKYWSSKNFFKFIRPGAVQIESDINDENMGIVAFQHEDNQQLSIVVINDSDDEKIVSLEDEFLNRIFDVYKTSATTYCELDQPLIRKKRHGLDYHPNQSILFKAKNSM